MERDLRGMHSQWASRCWPAGRGRSRGLRPAEATHPWSPPLVGTAPAAPAGGGDTLSNALAGRLAGRWRRPPLIGAGYGLAATGTLVALASRWPLVAVDRDVDRIGEGLYGHAWNPLLVTDIPPARRGRVFASTVPPTRPMRTSGCWSAALKSTASAMRGTTALEVHRPLTDPCYRHNHFAVTSAVHTREQGNSGSAEERSHTAWIVAWRDPRGQQSRQWAHARRTRNHNIYQWRRGAAGARGRLARRPRRTEPPGGTAHPRTPPGYRRLRS